jgi:hypothetical protein
MPSFVEAQHCPRCGEQGEQTHRETVTDMSLKSFGSSVYTYTCRNERCRWFNTGWIIQVDKNGEIPVRQAGPKQFQDIHTPSTEAAARHELEAIGYTIENDNVRPMTSAEKDELWGPGWREIPGL